MRSMRRRRSSSCILVLSDTRGTDSRIAVVPFDLLPRVFLGFLKKSLYIDSLVVALTMQESKSCKNTL